MSDQTTEVQASPEPSPVDQFRYVPDRFAQLPGVTVAHPGHLEHVPAASVNTEAEQAFEAARAGERGGHVHYPAGWASPEHSEAAERAAMGQEIDREQEQAARDARENLIAERIAARRSAGAAEPAPEPAMDGEFAKGLARRA